jgi:hypothetical protein
LKWAHPSIRIPRPPEGEGSDHETDDSHSLCRDPGPGARGAGRLARTGCQREWAFNVQTDQGGGTPTLTFKQEGEKLTGKYAGQLGNADLTGTVKGNAIHFTFTLDVQGQQAPVTYDGTIDKNTMKGKMDIGGMVNGTFTGTKK